MVGYIISRSLTVEVFDGYTYFLGNRYGNHSSNILDVFLTLNLNFQDSVVMDVSVSPDIFPRTV